MSKHLLLAFGALLLASAPTASAQNLTEAQARASSHLGTASST